MKKQLTLRRILSYSSASAGLNIMGISVSTWILYFYSPPLDSGRTIYIPISVIGILMGLSTLWDAVIDPLIGHWSDTLRNRWGRRRPFILLAAPLCSLALIFIWTPPQDQPSWVNAVYFFAIITIFYTAFSLVGIPYDASMPEMASSNQELVKLSTWKNIFGILGVIIGALVAAPLFDSLGPISMGFVVGAVGLGTIWFSLMGLRETKKPIGNPVPIIQGFKATFSNKQFMYMFLSVLVIHIAYAMITANLPYFVTLVVKENEGAVGLFQGVLVLTMLISAPGWNWLSKKYPNRKLLTVTMIALALTLFLNFTIGWFPILSPKLHGLITFSLTGPILGGYFILAYAMMGSVVDYDQMHTNSRREAIFYGTFSLAASLGPSLAALILPAVLERYGYSSQNYLGVQVAWLASAFFAILGAIIFTGYKLGDSPEETRKNLKINLE